MGWGGGLTLGVSARARLVDLLAPAGQHLVGVEPEVGGVVAQEALGVDGRRQVRDVAAFERHEMTRADLRLALGARQIDALAFAGGLQDLTDIGGTLGLVRPRVPARRSSPDACFLARGHPAMEPSLISRHVPRPRQSRLVTTTAVVTSRPVYPLSQAS